MVVPKLQFLDLSHWSWPVDWDKLALNRELIAVGWKATEGNYNTDPYYARARVEATKRGYLWLAYHFATNNPVSEQVDHFLNVARPNGSTRLALDWEDYGDKEMSFDQARQFLSMVDRQTNRISTLYSGNTAKEHMGNTLDPFMGKHPLWIPRYGSSVSVQPQPQISWSRWDIWQYAADGSGVQPNMAAGVKGHPDCNVFWDDVPVVRAKWSGIIRANIPPPAPRPPVVVQLPKGRFTDAFGALFSRIFGGRSG